MVTTYQLKMINKLKPLYYKIDTDIHPDFIYTIAVEDNTYNRNIIKSLGFIDLEIDSFKSLHTNTIELSHFIWNFVDWYDGEKFIVQEVF